MFGASAPTFTPDDLPDLTGRVILVTGGNAGLGYQSILAFIKKGAKVYMASRTESKAVCAPVLELLRYRHKNGSDPGAEKGLLAAIDELKTKVPDAKVEFLHIDLQSFASIKAAADTFLAKEPHLHVLLNNAGVLALPYALTEDGYEVQFGTNYMGHFLLTKLLTPVLIKTAETAPAGSVRVVNVSSWAHNFAAGYGIDFEDFHHARNPGNAWVRYGVSKLANILHTTSLASRLQPHGIIVTTLHPGFVVTAIYDTAASWNIMAWGAWAMLQRVFMSAEEGAYTQIYCAASEEVTMEDTGSYYVPVAVKGVGMKGLSGYAKDKELAEKLWVWSEKEVEKHEY